jgi:glycosyltransferase involved in cell wall biosynthesis
LEDAEAMAAAINYILANKQGAGALAAAGYAAYQADYSEAVVVQHYLDFFAKVAA